MTYDDVISKKVVIAERAGFAYDPALIDPKTKAHQVIMVEWALSLGRALVAGSFGLGKTRVQCEIARQVIAHTGRPFLIVCPLSVKTQFSEEDGPQLGQQWIYVRDDGEAFAQIAAGNLYLITNYERVRDGNLTQTLIDALGGVSLDEGSFLRSMSSKTSDVFKKIFKKTAFKYICTATPSPNEYKELIYYAEFLGVMDHGQALTRWFKRDPAHAGHLTLMQSQEEDFWLWTATWALFISKPSDIGCSDEGYSLPPIHIHWHRLAVDHTRAFDMVDNYGQRRMFLYAAGGVSDAAREKRATLADRLDFTKQLVMDDPNKHWIVWHHLEVEREEIQKAIPEVVSVYGSEDLEEREGRILGFSRGKFRILSTKPEIAGSGCNFQRHCHSAVFMGVDYKFQDFIQAVHRLFRFLQTDEVDIHIVYAESEDEIITVLKRKWTQHDKLMEHMSEIMKTYGLAEFALREGLGRRRGIKMEIKKGSLYTAVNNDCVKEMENIPDNQFGLVLTSIPFGNHYEYTTQLEDFGHNPSDDDFWKQMDYLIPELLRVTKPGRVAAIHVKDRQLYGHQTKSGFMELAPFSDECVMAFRKHGWMYESRRTIVTDVVRENASTYRLGYTEMTHDASKMSSGIPEYLLLFRKPPTSSENARADESVTKNKADYTRAHWQLDAHSYWRSDGNRLLMPDEAYDYQAHVERLEDREKAKNLPASFFSEPPVSLSPFVWDDVVFMRTLNSGQSKRNQENHICPLPFDIVERAIRLYSNEGDEVFDPFFGIGTVGHSAIRLGRRVYGVELNHGYWMDACHYCAKAEEEKLAPTLFDWLEIAQPEGAKP